MVPTSFNKPREGRREVTHHADAGHGRRPAAGRRSARRGAVRGLRPRLSGAGTETRMGGKTRTIRTTPSYELM